MMRLLRPWQPVINGFIKMGRRDITVVIRLL